MPISGRNTAQAVNQFNVQNKANDTGAGSWIAQNALMGFRGFGAGVVDAGAAAISKEAETRKDIGSVLSPKVVNPFGNVKKDNNLLQNIVNYASDSLKNLDFFLSKMPGIGTGVTAVNAAKKAITNAVINDVTAKLTGNETADELQNKVIDSVYSLTDGYYEAQSKLAKQGERFSPTTQFAGGVVQALTRMIPSIATSAVTRSPSIGLTAMGVSVGGSSAKEAKTSGATAEQAYDVGVRKALVEVGTELLFGGIYKLGKGVVSVGAEKVFAGFVNSNAGKVAMRVLDIGGEGVEEGISGLLDAYIDRAVYDDEAVYATVEEIGKEALMGVIISTLTQGYGAAVNMVTKAPTAVQEAQTQVQEPQAQQAVEEAPTAQTEAQEQGGTQPIQPNAPIAPQSVGRSVGAASLGFDPYSNLQNKYGNIPSGENPVRSDDMPLRTNPNDKVSYATRTVLGATVTPDSMVDSIQQFVVDGKASRIPLSNAQVEAKATKAIEEKGFVKALTDWTADARSGKASADMVALGAVLYNNASNSGDGELTLDILQDYIELNKKSRARVTSYKNYENTYPRRQALHGAKK